MKVASWIFTVLSFLAIPLVFAFWALTKAEDPWVEILVIGIILFFVLGFVGHILATKYRMTYGSGCKVQFILTYPAFVIPLLILGAIWLFLSALDYMIYCACRKHVLAEVLNWFRNILSNERSANSNSNNKKQEKEYIVVSSRGYERRLVLKKPTYPII